jgi:hexosaminidase
VPYTVSPGKEQYGLNSLKGIVVDAQFANSTDQNGETLIPPTLFQFATTFAADLHAIAGVEVPVTNGTVSSSQDSVVFLTLGDEFGYTDIGGRISSEAYELTTNASGIFIKGSSPLGVWWGTRTILQQAVLNNNSMPYGSGLDVPGWPVRGMMLDAGRHFYPKDFVVEMCAYMSFFKQNTFHLHLSDNLVDSFNYDKEASLELYARIRFWSDAPSLAGLNKFKNESYTRDEFDAMQTACAARGVTILPEIEAPGHALVVVQWKPEIGYYAGSNPDLSILNITHPETIPTMEAIWDEFLPWFHSRTVHIGADEYTGPETDYILFVNEMCRHMNAAAHKSIRIWGTFSPLPGDDEADFRNKNIYPNVSIQHWELYEDHPWADFINNSYSVVNSGDDFYVVNKYGGYPPRIKTELTFTGNPDGNTFWRPNIFSTSQAAQNPPVDNEFVLGAVSALWNDYGPNATVYLEAYYAWRDGLPALADKQWGGNLTSPAFWSAFAALHPAVPGQNLDRAVASVGATIVNYTLADLGSNPNSSASSDDLRRVWNDTSSLRPLRDTSGNGYDAKTDCAVTRGGTLAADGSCGITTPLDSKGRNYTLTLAVRIDTLSTTTAANASSATAKTSNSSSGSSSSPSNGDGFPVLLTGRDSQLVLTPNITLYASGTLYALAGAQIPLGTWVELTLVGRATQTFASLVDRDTGATLLAEREFTARLGIAGYSFRDEPMGIEAPVRLVGGPGCGWTGEVGGLSLTGVA